MKAEIITCIMLFCSSNGFCQEGTKLPADTEEHVIYQKVEINAKFPGGDEGWNTFLRKNLNTKLPKQNNAPEGTYNVVVYFWISEKGVVSNISSETHHGYGMEEEAIRVMKLSPKWTPVFQNGKDVKSFKRQTITFIIE